MITFADPLARYVYADWDVICTKNSAETVFFLFQGVYPKVISYGNRAQSDGNRERSASQR